MTLGLIIAAGILCILLASATGFVSGLVYCMYMIRAGKWAPKQPKRFLRRRGQSSRRDVARIATILGRPSIQADPPGGMN